MKAKLIIEGLEKSYTAVPFNLEIDIDSITEDTDGTVMWVSKSHSESFHNRSRDWANNECPELKEAIKKLREITKILVGWYQD